MSTQSQINMAEDDPGQGRRLEKCGQAWAFCRRRGHRRGKSAGL